MIEPKIYCKVCGMTMQCIADFYKENKRRPIVLEIGCADGQGVQRYGGFCERVICVDPMVQGRPDIFSSDQNDTFFKPDDSKIADFKRRTGDYTVDLVIGCSLWKNVIDEVERRLNGSKVDILVIDGCHHPFEAVWGDFQAYLKFVSDDGFVIFDDLYEECIIQAYDKAQTECGFVEHERWSVRNDHILQDVGALRRKK